MVCGSTYSAVLGVLLLCMQGGCEAGEQAGKGARVPPPVGWQQPLPTQAISACSRHSGLEQQKPPASHSHMSADDTC
jgi:hypothetical protein